MEFSCLVVCGLLVKETCWCEMCANSIQKQRWKNTNWKTRDCASCRRSSEKSLTTAQPPGDIFGLEGWASKRGASQMMILQLAWRHWRCHRFDKQQCQQAAHPTTPEIQHGRWFRQSALHLFFCSLPQFIEINATTSTVKWCDWMCKPGGGVHLW